MSMTVGQRPAAALPPGQRRVDGFPRFGSHLDGPAPTVPPDPVITVGGAVTRAVEVPVVALADLPRRAVAADFHCVAGWTATGLRWEGVPFEAFYRTIVEPVLEPGATITHVAFRGLDGYRSVVWLEDAMVGDVLIADTLDGRPLDSAHGAPVRLVSPQQYGYVSIKHLCAVEVHTGAPRGRRSFVDDVLLRAHPRARVALEERHGSLPGWLVRPVYRAIKAPLLWLCNRGSAAR